MATINTTRLLRLIWVIAGLGLFTSVVREPLLKEHVLRRLISAPGDWVSGGFQAPGHYPGTVTRLPADLRRVGSWLDGDEWQGKAETVWTAAGSRTIRVWVAGYPNKPGCFLRAEFKVAGGAVEVLNCDLPDPRETWQPWDISPPPGASTVRFVAEDRSAAVGGWLAFSEPTIAPPTTTVALFMGVQVCCTLALALVLTWGPGLLWLPEETTPETRAVYRLGLGPALLVGLGLLVWALDGVFRPHILGFALVTAAWAGLGVSGWRRARATHHQDMMAVGISALIALAAVAKSTYGGGPAGELYGGTISRTLAVGDRSDARISYHVVQTAAHHLSPTAPEAEAFFSPWNFFSRGPLAGLAALPVTMAMAGPTNLALPDAPWAPFDTTGFAAYRIALITLASLVIYALFAAVKPIAGEQWALLAAGLLALSPFGLHEVMFTWPKWEATTGVLVSFLLAHQRRPVAAGVALAVGFLFHPLAGLCAPWLALWAAGRAGARFNERIGGAVRYSLALCAVVLPWMIAGRLAPHSPNAPFAGQQGFFNYFLMADGGPANWASWWQSRWLNLSNTFLPFWLFLFHANHPSLTSVYSPSGPLVKFAFGWWTTLPLGMGLLTWAVTSVTLVQHARQFAAALLLLVVGPALLLVAYWGAHTTGLMRECGHPVLPAMIGLACVALAGSTGRITRFVTHPALPWLQLPETFAMLWLTTLANRQPLPASDGGLSWVYLLVNVAALATAAWLLSRARMTNPS